MADADAGAGGSSAQPYARGELIHDLFSECARRSPHSTAVVHGNRRISYGELETAAQRYSACLADAGVGPGHLVPVILPRSIPLVVAFLGILKRGAAYAALDGRWPVERLNELIRALDAPSVVTDVVTDLAARRLPPPDLAVSGAAADSTRRAVAPDAPAVAGDSPAAVFFTSGSTGRPKAALSPHRGTVRLFQDCPFATFTEQTVMPLAAALPWDALTLELWGVLLNGGCSVVVDEPFLLPATLRQIVSRNGVNKVWLTSSLFNMFVDEDIDAFTGLDEILVGGERVSAAHIARALRRHPRLAVVHGYGPVESTVFASTHRVTLADCDRPDGIPLGAPVPNTGLYVWNGTGLSVPGEVGELLITGDGLACGYLGAAEQTAKQFPTLWLDGREQRAYRTGDLVHRSAQGTLHFDGRADRQVKVRGHRIEPAEIEQAMAMFPGVSECVAVPVRGGTGGFSRMVLAYTTRSGDPAQEVDVLDRLRSLLPAHLVPDAAVFLPQWPLTGNGKLDVGAVLRAFADRQADGVVGGHDGGGNGYLVDLVQETMAAVLDVPGVPLDADFFSLGGTSLQLGAVCTRLATALGVPVPIAEAVRRLTARQLAGWLGESRTIEQRDPRQAADDRPGVAVLTSMQESFWLRQATAPDDVTGLCPLAWWIDGPVDERALTAALHDVHRRHEALRGCYGPDDRHDDDRPVVVPMPATCAPEFHHLTAASEQEGSERLHEALIRPLDIEAGEVWRSALVRIDGERRALLGIAVHHIAFDGWSEHVLVGDLSSAYAARLAGVPPVFGSTPRTLDETSGLLRQANSGTDLSAARRYWRELLTDIPELQLPLPTPDPAATTATSRRRVIRAGSGRFRLDAADLAVVDRLAREHRVTRFTVLLATYAAALQAVTGQADFGLGVPVSRRDGTVLADTIGCLIDVVCLRARPVRGGWRTLIEHARDSLRDALAMQGVSFPEVVRLVNPRRTLRDPLYQVMLAYQDSPRLPLQLSGCDTGRFGLTPAHATSELVTELWPQPDGAMTVDMTYQRDLVADHVAADVMRALVDIIRNGPAGSGELPAATPGSARPMSSGLS
ncbi:amino acid adenylation domain-containing protein [Micromonospora sp. NPDC000663]|uniref:amino acid adenylation domain-containing protein n=1 Tax=Micromonospora sp. NPDC000663 TaxID=3364218 RepID=UPI0036B6B7FE